MLFRSFFGGYTDALSPSDSKSSRIDIYDVMDDSWTGASLSEAKDAVMAALAGAKIVFAGGLKNGDEPSGRVDIFDIQLDQWSSAILAGPAREIGAAIAINELVYLCGGITSRVNKMMYFPNGQQAGNAWVPQTATRRIEIFNTLTNTWTFDSMQIPRIMFSALATSQKIYFAGGVNMNHGFSNIIGNHNYTSAMEVKSLTGAPSQTHCLSSKKASFSSVLVGDNAIFAPGLNDHSGKLDIYNTINDAWSVAWEQNVALSQSSMVVVGQDIYVICYFGGSTLLLKLMF